MPATSRYALPYPAAGDPADVPLDMQELADRIEAVVAMPALSATPPGAPVDGQLWALSPVAGLVWLFRYNAGSASTYKWELVGGAPLSGGPSGTVSGYSGTTYANFTGGPTFALPRPGDYQLRFGCRMQGSGTALADAFCAAYDGTAVGKAALFTNGSAGASTVTNGSASVAISELRTGLGAVTLTLQVKTSPANAYNFLDGWLEAVPRRVS